MFQTAYAKFGCVASRVCGLLNNNGRTEAVCDTADRETNRPATLRTDQSMDDGKRASTDQCNAQAIRDKSATSPSLEPVSRVYTIIAQWCKVTVMCSMTSPSALTLNPSDKKCNRKPVIPKDCSHCSSEHCSRDFYCENCDISLDNEESAYITRYMINHDLVNRKSSSCNSPRHRWKQENATRQLDEYFYNLVVQLVEEGEDVNYSDFAGYTPLMLACANRHHKAINLLIKLGSNINFRNQEGATALMLSSSSDDVTAVKTLVNAGADLDVLDCHEQTALMEASMRGGQNVVRALVESGASTNVRDSRGRTSLHLAILHGHYAVAHCLVSFGMCDINAQDEDGYTPMFLAAWDPGSDHPGADNCSRMDQAVTLVDRLAEKGANVDSVDSRNIACLVRSWNRKPVIHALIKNGACVNQVLQVGKNEYPLPLVAALEGDQDMVDLLRKAGYDSAKLLSSVFLLDERHSRIISHLTQVFSSPLPLKDICRLSIRECCGKVKLKCKLAFLPLPASVIDYLLFNE